MLEKFSLDSLKDMSKKEIELLINPRPNYRVPGFVRFIAYIMLGSIACFAFSVAVLILGSLIHL